MGVGRRRPRAVRPRSPRRRGARRRQRAPAARPTRRPRARTARRARGCPALKAASRGAASAGGSAWMPSGLERQTATTSIPSAAASAARCTGSCASGRPRGPARHAGSTRQRAAASQRMRGVHDAAQGRRWAAPATGAGAGRVAAGGRSLLLVVDRISRVSSWKGWFIVPVPDAWARRLSDVSRRACQPNRGTRSDGASPTGGRMLTFPSLRRPGACEGP